MLNELQKVEWIRLDGRSFPVRFYQRRGINGRGRNSYFAEITFDMDDKVLIDGANIKKLERKVFSIFYASAYARAVARRS